ELLRRAPPDGHPAPPGATGSPVDRAVASAHVLPEAAGTEMWGIMSLWPAPDAVALYFGRARQENRFSQEDRETALGRILSYELPGQELASLVGLFLMNYRTARG